MTLTIAFLAIAAIVAFATNATTTLTKAPSKMRQVIPRIYTIYLVPKCPKPPANPEALFQSIHQRYNEPMTTDSQIFPDILLPDHVPRRRVLFILEALKVMVATDPQEYGRKAWKLLVTILKYHVGDMGVAAMAKKTTRQLFLCLPELWREEATAIMTQNILLFQYAHNASAHAIKVTLSILSAISSEHDNLRDFYAICVRLFEANDVSVYYPELARFIRDHGDKHLFTLLVNNCFSARAEVKIQKYQMAILRYLLIRDKLDVRMLNILLMRIHAKQDVLQKSLLYEILSYVYERLLVLAAKGSHPISNLVDVPGIYRLGMAMSTNHNLVRYRRERLLIILAYWARRSRLQCDLSTIISRLKNIRKVIPKRNVYFND